MARPGGVLARAGHTEAGCDLVRLAGLEPAAVIVEVLNEDGTMARRPDLQRFAREHGLRIGTIADLIRYRLMHEHSVERVSETMVQTEFGEFRFVAYQDTIYNTLHGALVMGSIDPEQAPLVRVHLRMTLSDVFGIEHARFSFPIRKALQRIAQEKSGVLLILRRPETPQEIVSQLVGLKHSEADGAAAPHDPHVVLRTHGIGSQILTDLGVRKMRLLMRVMPSRIQAISGFDLEVTEYVSI
jgi:3,4-dihydroxy 2-butanone 4-phosphate synthase/GTP cyclohydrolase II